MSYRRDLKLLRRAQKQAKRQLRQLAKLELTGLTAVTLHAHTRQVTITLASATGAPFTDTLREALRERRQALQRSKAFEAASVASARKLIWRASLACPA